MLTRIRITRRESSGLDASEHTESVRFMRHVNMNLLPNHPELRWLHHIPNGGWRKRAVAGKLKAEGVKPGVYDYCLPWPRGVYHGLYLEMKADKGRLSAEQKEFREFVTAQGYRVVEAWGWEEAYSAVCDYIAL